jgi:hypothetical protein
VLSKVLAERLQDALAQIEATRLTSAPHSATSGAAVTEAVVATKVRRPPLAPAPGPTVVQGPLAASARSDGGVGPSALAEEKVKFDQQLGACKQRR